MKVTQKESDILLIACYGYILTLVMWMSYHVTKPLKAIRRLRLILRRKRRGPSRVSERHCPRLLKGQTSISGP